MKEYSEPKGLQHFYQNDYKKKKYISRNSYTVCLQKVATLSDLKFSAFELSDLEFSDLEFSGLKFSGFEFSDLRVWCCGI